MEQYKKSKAKSRIVWGIAIVLAVVQLVIAVLPFFFMILNSFKERFEMLTEGVFSIPNTLYLGNYQEVLGGKMLRFFTNSVVVLVVSLAVLLAVSACAAYPLARFKFRFNALIYGLIVACMSIPIHVTLIPIFKMTNTMHLYDSIWSLIGPYVAVGVPVSVFILTSFMKNIPKEIEESAEIDGCNKFQMFSKMILPLSKPGLSTLAIYNGVNMWNEFSFAYTLTQTAENRTLPLAVWEYRGQYSMNTPMIMAVLVLTLIPMLLLFIFAQDKLVKGMTAGAVKG